MTDRPRQIKGLLWGNKIKYLLIGRGEGASSHRKSGGCLFLWNFLWNFFWIFLWIFLWNLPMKLKFITLDFCSHLLLFAQRYLLTFIAWAHPELLLGASRLPVLLWAG